MFTLELILENNRKEKYNRYYTGTYRFCKSNSVPTVSTNEICAKKFKTMGSAKGVATRLYKKLSHKMVGYEIKKVEV